jgi:hypothetical protein
MLTRATSGIKPGENRNGLKVATAAYQISPHRMAVGSGNLPRRTKGLLAVPNRKNGLPSTFIFRSHPQNAMSRLADIWLSWKSRWHLDKSLRRLASARWNGLVSLFTNIG